MPQGDPENTTVHAFEWFDRAGQLAFCGHRQGEEVALHIIAKRLGILARPSPTRLALWTKGMWNVP
jgi:hypothetical protein